MTQIELYETKQHHRENNQLFRDFMSENPLIHFWHPNKAQAPWHVQARSPGGVLLNFYPHTLKAHADGAKCVAGIEAMWELLLLEDEKVLE